MCTDKSTYKIPTASMIYDGGPTWLEQLKAIAEGIRSFRTWNGRRLIGF